VHPSTVKSSNLLYSTGYYIVQNNTGQMMLVGFVASTVNFSWSIGICKGNPAHEIQTAHTPQAFIEPRASFHCATGGQL